MTARQGACFDRWTHFGGDGAAARARVAALREATAPLRAAESALFVALFGGAPAIFFTSLSERWPAIAAFAAAAWLATVLLYVRARRRGFRAGGTPPAPGSVTMLAMWPLAAMRASDVLGRHLLADLAPLAAATLLPRERFRDAARRELAELRFAVEPRDAWLDERRRRALARFLAAEKVDVEALFAPPAPDDPAVRAYCPRCRAQYVTARERCASCDGIRVLPL